MSMRTVGGVVLALLLGSCSLLNSPENEDLCSEHGDSCDPLADCISDESTFRCVCKRGYRDVHGDGTLCRDRDECEDGSARCHVLATCTNEPPGSFTCTCPPGYRESAEGRQCDEVDECALSQSACDPDTQLCMNVDGPRWECLCMAGYEPGQGAGCDDIDECLGDEHDCQAPAECKNNPGGFSCECPAGVAPLDSRSCETHDPCGPGHNDCGEHTQCVVVGSNAHECECLPGYERLDSARCRDIDECLAAPCRDRARCVNSEGSFSCECEGYYTAVDGGCEDRRLGWSTALPAYLLMQPLADESGNVLLAGTFSGTIELCGAPYTARGQLDVFLVKYGPEPERTCLWAHSYGDVGVDELISATIDLDGNPVLGITFLGVLDFTGAEASSDGVRARAIVKLDGNNGHGLWARRFHNVDRDDAGSRILYSGLSTDARGDVMWATGVRSGVPIDAAMDIAGTAERDGIVVKLRALDGSIAWSRAFGSPFEAIATGVTATPTGDIAVAGIFQNWIEIGGESLQTQLRDNSRWSGFAAVLRSDDGSVRWGRLIEGFVDPANTHRAVGLSVAATDDDQVVVGGSFEDTLEVATEKRSAGGRDMFLVGLDSSDGEQTWLRTFGNASDDVLDHLVYADGGLVAVGSFDGLVVVGDTRLRTFGRDVFALALDPRGEPLWLQRFGGMGFDHVAGVAKSPQGDTYATGCFVPPMRVGDSELPSFSPDSAFVLQLRR